MNCLIHQTDLYHPHEDPDDHFDLATVFALAKLGRWDLKGVLIDYPPEREEGDPAAGAVLQMGRLTGITGIPVVVGTRHGMRNRRDAQSDRPLEDRAAADWVCAMLESSPHPVAINISGSCTDVALAGLRAPDLFRRKCRGIYVNAGAAHPNASGELEYNVQLNPSSFAAIFDIPCPIYWCPCFNETGVWDVGKNGTWWSFVHGDLFGQMEDAWCQYFLYMLSRSADPRYLRYLDRPMDAALLGEFAGKTRNMWCTGPLVHAAGLAVDIEEGLVEAGKARDPLFDFQRVSVECADDGRVTWQPANEETGRHIFRILHPEAYQQALARVLARLFQPHPEA